MSLAKTKMLIDYWMSSSKIHVGSVELEKCDEFCYLGSIVK